VIFDKIIINRARPLRHDGVDDKTKLANWFGDLLTKKADNFTEQFWGKYSLLIWLYPGISQICF
jgi:hypothetical protein